MQELTFEFLGPFLCSFRYRLQLRATGTIPVISLHAGFSLRSDLYGMDTLATAILGQFSLTQAGGLENVVELATIAPAIRCVV